MIDLPPVIYNALQRFVQGDFERQGSVIKALHLPKGSRVLELGCGTGLLARFFDPDVYVGIDSDPTRIAAAREAFPEHTFIVGDASQMDGAMLAEFDMAMCHGLIHHVDDEGVERIKQTCRDAAAARGGPFGFLAIEAVLPDPAWKNPVGFLLAKCDRGRYVRPISRLREIFGSAVVKIEEIEPPMRWPVPGAAVHTVYGTAN